MRLARIATAALCALWLSLAAAFAYDAAITGQSERAAIELRAEIDRIAQDLGNPALPGEQLARHRIAVEVIRTRALEQSLKLADPVSEVKQQIASLGPAPADGKTEAAGVADARKNLQATLDRLQSSKSQLDVLAVEAEQLAGRIGAIQREQFFQRIFKSGRSIVNPLLWIDAGRGAGLLADRVGVLLANWWSDVSKTANPVWLGLIPLFIVLFVAGYITISRWFRRWTQAHAAPDHVPDDITRLWRVVRGLITSIAAVLILAVPLYLAFEAGGYSTPRFQLVSNAIFQTLFGTTLYYMFARRIAAPGMSAWRIIDIDDTAAAQLPVLIGLAAFVAVAHRNLLELANALFMPVTYTIGQSAAASLVMLVLLSLIMLTLRNQDGLPNAAGRRVYFRWALPLRRWSGS